NFATAVLPSPPTAVEQTHVTDSPVAQDPPDAGCVLAGIVIIDDHAGIPIDSQLADARTPHGILLHSKPCPTPADRIHPDRAGNMARGVLVLAARIQDAVLLGSLRLG